MSKGRTFYQFVHLLKQWAWYFSKGLVIRLSSYEGRLADSEERLRCLVMGSTFFPADFTSKIYADAPQVTSVVRIPFFLLSAYLRFRRSEYDLCIAVLPFERSFLLDGVSRFVGHGMVTQKIDTSGGWEEIRKRMSRSKRNWINHYRKDPSFELKVSGSDEDIKFFYERMFVPYTLKRYGGHAVVDSYAKIADLVAHQGMLMFLMHEGEPVAASLCQRNGAELEYRRVGVLDGNEAILEAGALMALYYYQIDYAVEHQLSRVDLGQSRAFLTEGVFDNKARWGAHAIPNIYGSTLVHYIFAGPSPQLARAFELCPVIVNQDSGLRALIGHTGEASLAPGQLQAALKGHHLSGIARATVISAEAQHSAIGSNL